MLKSMTGYGSAERATDGRRVRAEVRSVNQRFLDIQVKAPRLFLRIEDRIRRHIESRLHRGRVTVYMEWRDESEGAALAVNRVAAGRLVDELKTLSGELGVSGEIDMAILTRFPHLFEQADDAPVADALWTIVEPVLETATAGLVAMREEEGRQLGEEFVGRLKIIESLVAAIEQDAPRAAEAMKTRMSERITAFIGDGIEVDQARLAQELASSAERADFTEEIVRLKVHIEHSNSTLSGDGPSGKRLNFLVQEMHREANTIGSKNVDLDVATSVLSLKEEIEKLREQVQNVE
ncbi:YicC family protein [bacterium]|nr:YicC family protein [bacterium]